MELTKKLFVRWKNGKHAKNNTVKELFECLKQEKTDSEMQEIERDKIMDKLIFILTKN